MKIDKMRIGILLGQPVDGSPIIKILIFNFLSYIFSAPKHSKTLINANTVTLGIGILLGPLVGVMEDWEGTGGEIFVELRVRFSWFSKGFQGFLQWLPLILCLIACADAGTVFPPFPSRFSACWSEYSIVGYLEV